VEGRRPAGPPRWAGTERGPTATSAQRARRRRQAGSGERRALVFSRRPPGEALAGALADAGLAVEWTDSGPEAIGEAVDQDLAVCIVGVCGAWKDGLDHLPCLSQVNPSLPVIVVSDSDSIETQRWLRSHRIFYYLVGAIDRRAMGTLLAAALAGGARA
jgi:DNA-binding NtrC family response regulator